MANPKQAEAAPVAAAGKKRLPLIAGAVVVVLALGGGAFAFMHKGASAADKANTAQAHPADKVALYMPLDPAFVVNLRDGDSLRYLQVGITLMAHDGKVFDTVKESDPVIRDALLSLLGSESYTQLVEPAGRSQLQAKALATVQKIVQDRIGSKGIQALYFTSFVIQ